MKSHPMIFHSASAVIISRNFSQTCCFGVYSRFMFEGKIMDEIRNDGTMQRMTRLMRSMYVFAVAYFAYGFWSARAAFYSHPIGVLIVVYIGLCCGYTVPVWHHAFCKATGNRARKNLFSAQKKECIGGNEQ